MIPMIIESLIESAARLRDDLTYIKEKIIKEKYIDCIYNPLSYAWLAHKAFIEIGGGGGAKTILLGMNPGPHGMGQMGIPFAATSVVRDLMGIKDLEIGQPDKPHPKRKVAGLKWHKEEISGTRLWNLLSDHYGEKNAIFSNIFIVNHCPLMFFKGPKATNITPDRIPGEAIKEVIERCDQHLREVVKIMDVKTVIGVGKYAEKRAKIALKNYDVEIKSCWHPSPASPLANKNEGRDWRENVISTLP